MTSLFIRLTAILWCAFIMVSCGSSGGGTEDNSPTGNQTTTVHVTFAHAEIAGTVAMPAGSTVHLVVDGQTITPDSSGSWSATVPFDGTTRSVTITKFIDDHAVSTRDLTVQAQHH
jgi:hypothetical protein